MSTADFAGKKILFTAFSVDPGSEAMAGYAYLKKHGASDISTAYWGGDEIAKQIPDDVTKLPIDSRTDIASLNLADCDIIFRHTNTPPQLLADHPGVTSFTREFFAHCPATIIGVTGTKGKGTTSSLIHKMLQVAGKTVHLVGNIGQPAITVLDDIKADDLVVFEISSFQLWDLPQSPPVGVVLMIEPDHLDVHSSMEEYVEAKAQIAQHQTASDVLVYNPNNDYAQAIAKQSAGDKRPYLRAPYARVEGDALYYGQTEVCKLADVALPGAHNLENICAAITAYRAVCDDIKSIAQALAEFKGLPNRLETIAVKNERTYVNDSFSAAPSATIAAMRAFDQPKVLILGGSPKKVIYDSLATEVMNNNVRRVILIGQTADELETALQSAGYQAITKLGANTTMPEIVQKATESSEAGDVILLSPACASFDMFHNYKDRAQQFVAAVEGL